MAEDGDLTFSVWLGRLDRRRVKDKYIRFSTASWSPYVADACAAIGVEQGDVVVEGGCVNAFVAFRIASAGHPLAPLTKPELEQARFWRSILGGELCRADGLANAYRFEVLAILPLPIGAPIVFTQHRLDSFRGLAMPLLDSSPASARLVQRQRPPTMVSGGASDGAATGPWTVRTPARNQGLGIPDYPGLVASLAGVRHRGDCSRLQHRLAGARLAAQPAASGAGANLGRAASPRRHTHV